MHPWTSIFHSRFTNGPVIWTTTTAPRPQSLPGGWICTGSVTWESLLTEGIPYIAAEKVLLMASSSTVSLTALRVVPRLPHRPKKSSCSYSRRDSSRSLAVPSHSCISHCSASALLGFPFRTEANHWISLANSWPCSSFCLLPFEPHCGIQFNTAFGQISSFSPFPWQFCP